MHDRSVGLVLGKLAKGIVGDLDGIDVCDGRLRYIAACLEIFFHCW